MTDPSNVMTALAVFEAQTDRLAVLARFVSTPIETDDPDIVSAHSLAVEAALKHMRILVSGTQ